MLSDAHGQQVAYNGHLLYTFASDRAGQVSGQGFQSFFVATPGLGPIASSPAPGAPSQPPRRAAWATEPTVTAAQSLRRVTKQRPRRWRRAANRQKRSDQPR